MRKISKNIWKESESKIKMSTENEHQCSFLFLLHLYKNDIAHKKIGKKNIKNSDIQNNWLPLTAK